MPIDSSDKVELGEYLSLQASHARLERELRSFREDQSSQGTAAAYDCPPSLSACHSFLVI